MGDGSDPAQVSIENEVVNDFNASQTRIHLVLEVVPRETAVDTFATEIAAGVGPDIVGPINWFEANIFAGQWLDLAPGMAASGYDTSRFDPAMSKVVSKRRWHAGLAVRRLPLRHFLQHQPLQQSRDESAACPVR